MLAKLNSRDELESYSGRFKWLFLAFVLPFALIGARLWQVQVLDSHEFDRRARNNLVRTVEIPATRGLILDSGRRVLAENRPSYDVYITPRLVRKEPEALDLLQRYLNLAADDIARIRKRMEEADGRAFLARRDITRDQVAQLETHRMYLPGVEVRTNSHRYYPYNELSSHTMGFMNEITGDELESRQAYGYRPGDYIGRMGLERTYEAILRGSPGLERQIVDARGIPQGEEQAEELLGHYRRVEPIPGRNLVLTLDMDLQRIAREEFNYDSGAVVAINPKDGSVLAALSVPTFNPNSWTGRLSHEEKRRSDNNPFKPMIDKTVQAYFPGSTFKLVTAAAALNEGFITEKETLECRGFYEFGKRRFHCWNRVGHGREDLADSLMHSCDVYYYKLSEKLGMDTLARYAYMFGFGERAGMGINGEQRGIVPTKDWHRKHSPGGFQHGLTLSTGVGQGDTRVTPLQLALSYGALATRGTLYYPRIVDHIETADGRKQFEYPARIRRKLDIPEEILEEIEIGMTSVLHDQTGTSYENRLDYVTTAGKTGTAQVRGFDQQRLGDNGEIEYKHRDHAWFVVYGPVEDPDIVLAVFVEHGGSGARIAAPLAMKILDRYFREVKGIDPEAARARAIAQRRRGPRRLRRPDNREEPSRWERPSDDSRDGESRDYPIAWPPPPPPTNLLD
ncbi:MAG: penicillin-binding protein 2 [Myxococcales bacterium]|nr:penicillin-binding protein 2 [Myxococcales bacterium]